MADHHESSIGPEVKGNGQIPPPLNGAGPDSPDEANPFENLSAWRITPEFQQTGATEKALREVAVGKPSKQEFFRVHPGLDYRLDVGVIELEGDRSTYLIHPTLLESPLKRFVRPVTLFTCQNVQKVTYLWPIGFSREGSSNSWIESARARAEDAMHEFIQLVSNQDPKAKRYEMARPLTQPPDPTWPSMPFWKLIELAFADRYIKTLDHPTVRKLLHG